MDGPAHELPLELELHTDGTWRDRWREQQLFLVVAGTKDAPAEAHVATMRDVMSRWPEVQQTIRTFVAGLASGEHVPLTRPELGGFAAASCGFDQTLSFESISVADPSSPKRVRVTFYTGFPDGYATYAVFLDDGVPTGINAFGA